MRKVVLFLIVFFALNCSAFAKEQSLNQERTVEIQNIAKVLLEAKHTGNYEKLTKNMSEDLKKIYPQCNVVKYYAPIKTEVGEIEKFETIESAKTQYGDTLILNAFYKNLTKPVKVKITVDTKNKIQDFYEYFLSQSEKEQADQLMEKAFNAIYKNNDYGSFLECFIEIERKKITQEKFQKLQKNTIKSFGNFKSFSLKNYTISNFDFGQKVPARPVCLTYLLKFENKEIPFKVVPIDDEKANIYFGCGLLDGYSCFELINSKSGSNFDKKSINQNLEKRTPLELTVENKIKVNSLVKKAFKALGENDYDSFVSIFNTKDYKCQISDGAKGVPITKNNFENLYKIVTKNGGVKVHYSDDAVPFRGIMKTEVEGFDYYGTTGNEKYDIRMYSLFALRDGEIKIVKISPYFVEKDLLQNIERIAKNKLSALEQLNYNTFVFGLNEKEYPKDKFCSLSRAIKNDCGQNPQMKRKMFGISNNDEIYVDFTVLYNNGQSFDLHTVNKVNERNQVEIKQMNIDYIPASYLKKINAIAEINLNCFFNKNDFEKMKSTFEPELLKVLTVKQIKELKGNQIFKLEDKHYLKKKLVAREEGKFFDKDSSGKLSEKIKFKCFIYNILTDKGELIFKLTVNDDYENPKVLGINFNFPIQLKRVANINEL